MNDNEKTQINITEHAKNRAKERLGWNAETLDRMAKIAYDNGVKHSDTSGSLNRYLTKLYLNYKNSNNTRIYGEYIYLFNGRLLITVMQLPNKMKRRAKCARQE